MGTDTYRPNVRARELWPFFALRSVEAVAWHPYHDLPAIERVLPLVRRAGYQVNAWTVDDPQRIRALVALGATGIITNRPDVAREALGAS
jgi:glycerophosphoryl diester phosphodiesterase